MCIILELGALRHHDEEPLQSLLWLGEVGEQLVLVHGDGWLVDELLGCHTYEEQCEAGKQSARV